MKVIKHEVTGKPESMTLQTNPLVVWLTRNIELRIDKGDTLKEVLHEVRKHWKEHASPSLVAYWFAIGERQAAKKKLGDWSKAELRTDPKRCYLR